MYVPSKAFFTKGKGVHREKLTAFERALRQAKIAEYNLVPVSSIFPPRCHLVSRNVGATHLSPGQIVHCVLARQETNEAGRKITTSIGLALPVNKGHHGYLSESHSFGKAVSEEGDYAEDLAAEMLATVLGVDIDLDKSWDKKREEWKISGKIYKTTNIASGATGSPDGLWTCVISVLCFIK